MRRQLLSLLLVFALVLGMLPVAAFAAEVPDDAPFTSITTDVGAVGIITDMGTVDYTGYSTYSDIPYYHVQIPENAAAVYVTHPSSEDPFADASYGSAYGYYASTETWAGGGINYAFEAVDDGYTITLPVSTSVKDWSTNETTEVSFVADEDGYVGYAVAVERSDYSPICFFTFEYYSAAEGGETETAKPFLSISISGTEVAAENIAYKGIFELGDYAADEQQGVEDSYDYVHQVPYYHVTVPCGTASVDVTYSGDTNIMNSGSNAYGYKTDLEVDAVSSATVRGTTFKNAYTKNEDGTQTVKTPVTGYTFDTDGNGHAITLEEDGGSYAAVCLFSFAYDGKDHVYDSGNVTMAATCTADGVKTFTCSCGDSYTETVAAIGHSYADGTCANCGEADPDYVAPGAEIPDGINIEAITAVTEFTDGETISYYQWGSPAGDAPSYVATVPEGTQTVTITFKSGTHPDPYDSGDVMKLSGARAYYYYNADTDESYYNTDGKETTATQNDSGLWSIELNVADFLYTEQNYYGAYDASYGVQYFLAFQYPEGAHEHNYTEEVTTAPGCVTEGVKTFRCSCGDSYTEAIAAVGHSYDDGVETTPATCVADGVKTFTCSKCDAATTGHTKTETIGKLGHQYDEGVVTQEPTCTVAGRKTYTCTRETCTEETSNHTKVDTILATGHDYQNGECVNCGDKCPVQDANGVFQIGTAEELLWFAEAVNGGKNTISGALTADITVDADWPGIGNYNCKYAGSFDGQNHTVTLSGSTFGLFGYTMGTSDSNGNTKTVAVIQNVILDGTVKNSALIQNAGYTHITNCINKADITGGNANVAGIVGTVSGFMKYGQTYSDVLIQNCANEGSINGDKYTAGIVGYSQANTRLNSCSNTGTISGTNYVGGLVGFLQEAKGTCEIKNSYNHGTVSGSSYVGGICGDTYNGVNIENCYNAGECVYGITGHIYNKTASIVNCYYQGTKSDKGVPDNTFGISATAVTAVELSSDEFAAQLGSAYIQSCPAPALSWQAAESHTGMEEDGICDVCGLGGNVKEEYTVTFPAGEGITVTGEAAAIQGEAYTFTVTVNNGYRKTSTFAVKVNGDAVSESTEAADSYTVENVEGPLTIAVEGVEKIPETLTVTLPNGEGKGYRVNAVSDGNTVAYGGDYKFTVTMHENFREAENFQVLVNGSEAIYPDGEGIYTLTNVQENKAITVSGVAAKPYGDTARIMMTLSKGQNTLYRTPQTGTDQMLIHTELDVPYFDISLYGLDCYYNPDCYGFNDDGSRKQQTAGNPEIAYGKITVLHAFIYATEVHYLGLDENLAGTGVTYQDGRFQNSISWSGGVGSIFMKLWDHGTNLNYYVNYEYPLGQPGWGSTSDQILLHDGDVISAHMITSGETDQDGNGVVGTGASGSAFGAFVVNDSNTTFNYGTDTMHHYEVARGEEVKLSLYTSRATSTYDTDYSRLSGQQLYWIHDDDLVANLNDWNMEEDMVMDENGDYVLDTSVFEPGIYYIGAMGGMVEGDGTADAGGFVASGYERGPAVLVLTVTEGEGGGEEPEPATGDMNGDGFITADDAAAAYTASMSAEGLTDEQKAAADVNGDGFITADDAALIFEMSKGGMN